MTSSFQSINVEESTVRSSYLGDIRTVTTGSLFNRDLILEASLKGQHFTELFNPSKSPGCSAILREIITQSGIAFSVIKELSDDGDLNGHLGGNAIDVSRASVGDINNTRLIAEFLKSTKTLYSFVIYIDPIDSMRTLYIKEGSIIDIASNYPAVLNNSNYLLEYGNKIHVSSSFSQIYNALINDPNLLVQTNNSNLRQIYTDPVNTVNTSVAVNTRMNGSR